MNETSNPETELTAEDALKRRLLGRIAVAAVVVVGLLGSLAMFDAIYAPGHPVPVEVAALPPKSEAPPAAEPAKQEEPAAPAAETKPESAEVAKVEETAVPERTASPDAPPLQPLPAEKPSRPLTRPATGRPALMRPSEPVPPAASPAARPEPARELARSPAALRRAPASRPITQAMERQYALQMGVFSNVANAEDLRAKLELHGIPTSIEARVHVGPFKTREEVEVARAKLKELGLDGGLLVSLKK
ncbi:MAG: SPOR domain-containing protein [Sulfuritalea sp.]|nr:SPOR domain-containing protein [Sulfuritalea sp.]